jgi:hypothetical protein
VEPRPFSPNWYAEHPEAWRIEEPNIDVFSPADSSALALWLGVAELVGTASESASPSSTRLTASELREASGTDDAIQTTQWMPLGVFALRPIDGGAATRVVQLAVSPEGLIRGSHLDMISGGVHTLRGRIDKVNRRAALTIGNEGTTVFDAPLATFTEAPARLKAYFADGSDESWMLIPLR